MSGEEPRFYRRNETKAKSENLLHLVFQVPCQYCVRCLLRE